MKQAVPTHRAPPAGPVWSRRRLGRLAAAIAAVGLVAAIATAPAAAQDDAETVETVPLERFFGSWAGEGVSEGEDEMFLSLSAQDLDVTIGDAGDGFRVEWTTVFRTGSPDDPQIRRRSATLTFEPTDREGVWEAESSENPLEGGTLSWARLEGATLSVYQLVLNDAGGYDLTSYARTLDGEAMALVFTRLRDGAPIRHVRGRLTRTGE